jgi:two-component system, chemotaxis family, chemotaxis protein CheY
MKNVLVVDDSLYMREMIKAALTASGRYTIVGEAQNGNDAIEKALELTPDLITMDNILPDMLGIDVVKELRLEKVSAKILMVSAVGQENVISDGLASGADDYLVKPFSNEILVEKLDNLAAAAV